MVRPLSVVPEEPVHETVVECSDVVSEESPMGEQELLIERAVEPFDVGVHLGRTRIGVEVRKIEVVACFPEVKRELRTIVGLNERGTIR